MLGRRSFLSDSRASLSLIPLFPAALRREHFRFRYDLNVKLWQFSFNTLPELPEILTHGRERELFDWLFQHKARHPDRISATHRDRYVTCYSKDGAMSHGFAYYRAVAESAAQNLEFASPGSPCRR